MKVSGLTQRDQDELRLGIERLCKYLGEKHEPFNRNKFKFLVPGLIYTRLTDKDLHFVINHIGIENIKKFIKDKYNIDTFIKVVPHRNYNVFNIEDIECMKIYEFIKTTALVISNLFDISNKSHVESFILLFHKIKSNSDNEEDIIEIWNNVKEWITPTNITKEMLLQIIECFVISIGDKYCLELIEKHDFRPWGQILKK